MMHLTFESSVPVRRSEAATPFFHQIFYPAFLAVVFFASPSSQAADLPPHPTLLYADYKGKQEPVVAASGDKPVILVDGKRKALPVTTPLSSERAARYHAVNAVLNGAITNRAPIVMRDLNQQTIQAEEMTVSLDVTVDQDIDDCYLLLMSYDAASMSNPAIDSFSRIRVREVGSLRSGVTKKLEFKAKVNFPLRYASKPTALGAEFIVMEMFWQLFSNGAEVRSNVSERAAAFYREREKSALRMAIPAWRKSNPSGNRAAQPLLQIPPLLSSTEGLPPTCTATFSISADGTVVGLDFNPSISGEAATALTNTLNAWLFLPALKEGRPTFSQASLPLKF